MSRAGGWVALGCCVLAAVALGWTASQRAATAWGSVVGYRSPFARVALPPAGSGPAVSERVVLVIVDGLRADAAAAMPTVRLLGDHGTRLALRAPQPTLSYPNWTTILAGSTPEIHGVVTNWHEGAAPVETLLDTAARAGAPFAVVGPSDIATLFPAAGRATASFFRPWSDGEYLSGRFVDEALRIARAAGPRLLVILLPDADEAAHREGGASTRYLEVVARIDEDLRRLVSGLQDGRTTFVIVTDHGHTDRGGHGGWEPAVIRVKGVISGLGARVGSLSAGLEDIAPTIAVLCGIPVPRAATGRVLTGALTQVPREALAAAHRQRDRALTMFASLIEGSLDRTPSRALTPSGDDPERRLRVARERRLAAERRRRASGPAVWVAAGCVLGLAVLGVVSWRALVACLTGALAYHAFYNALFFIVHGETWSLSAFNTEDAIRAWMGMRMIEASLGGILAAGVAAAVYPLLREHPKGPAGRYVAGWLALGPAAVLTAQLILGVQIAWFEWAWGIDTTWGLPDLKWGFKYDLDLVQVTALGGAALVAPLVSFFVGRYHPFIRSAARRT